MLFTNLGIKVSAKVPGSIYSDLSRAKVLKDYLYHGYNDVNYRWVSYDNWTFVKQFHGMTEDYSQIIRSDLIYYFSRIISVTKTKGDFDRRRVGHNR